MNIENILENQGRGKTLEEREKEYLFVRKRVEKYLKKKKMSQSEKSKLLKDATLVLCVKWEKGYDVAPCLARHIGRNNLSLTMKQTTPANFAYVKKLVKIYNTVNILDRRRSKDEEE